MGVCQLLKQAESIAVDAQVIRASLELGRHKVLLNSALTPKSGRAVPLDTFLKMAVELMSDEIKLTALEFEKLFKVKRESDCSDTRTKTKINKHKVNFVNKK
jgi:hypothetical protein